MDSIKCVFITPTDFNSVIQFMRQNFLKDEPLNQSVNLQWSPAIESFIQYGIEQENSVMAIDTGKKNEIVGAMVQRIVKRGEKDTWVVPTEEPFKTIVDFLDHVQQKFDLWSVFTDIESFMDSKMAAVHRKYRGKRIGQQMIHFTTEFMRRERIPVVLATATSKYSRNILEQDGFKASFEMKYEDYKVDGKRVFETGKIHTEIAVMVKRL